VRLLTVPLYCLRRCTWLQARYAILFAALGL